MATSRSWLWVLLPAPLLAYIFLRPSPARQVLLTGLATAPFPGEHGEALVYVPEGLTGESAEVVVYLHGWNGCLANVVGARPSACPPGTVVHRASDILGQFQRSGRRAVLIVPELRYDAASGDPGQWNEQGQFAAFLREVQTRAGLGAITAVTLYAHSGGYQAAAAILERGGVAVRGVALLDALYGALGTFERFAPTGRLASLWTTAGGTAANNQALARAVGATDALPWNGRPVVARVDVEHGAVPQFVEVLLKSI